MTTVRRSLMLQLVVLALCLSAAIHLYLKGLRSHPGSVVSDEHIAVHRKILSTDDVSILKPYTEDLWQKLAERDALSIGNYMVMVDAANGLIWIFFGLLVLAGVSFVAAGRPRKGEPTDSSKR